MKFIRVYNRDLKVVGEIDDIESLIMEREYFGCGSFELHMGYRPDVFELMGEDKYLFVDNRPDRILLARQISLADGDRKVKIKGTDLLGLLENRVIVPPAGDNYLRYNNYRADGLMLAYVRSQCAEPSDSKRAFPNFIAYPASGVGEIMSWRASYDQNLLQVLYDIGIYAGTGHRMYIDMESGIMYYRVVNGKDLSGNGDLPPVLFSLGFDNLEVSGYEFTGNVKNAVYALSGDIDLNEHMVYLLKKEDELSGFDLKETYAVAQAENVQELIFEAARCIRSFENEESITAEIADTDSFRYERDWDLGDIVTVMHQSAGRRMVERITSIKEVYENDGRGLRLELTFGIKEPGFKKRIERIEKRVRSAGY